MTTVSKMNSFCPYSMGNENCKMQYLPFQKDHSLHIQAHKYKYAGMNPVIKNLKLAKKSNNFKFD